MLTHFNGVGRCVRGLLVGLLAVIGLLSLPSGCNNGTVTQSDVKNEPLTAPGEVTLYDQLGGGEAVYAITDGLIERALSDPRVNFTRRGHPHAWTPTPDNVARLKTYFAQYLGMLADGPQVYEGHNLMDVHHGMGISEGEWLAFLDDLHKTLEDLQIPAGPGREFLSRVAATHDVIVDQ